MDGQNSTPYAVDQSAPNLNRCSAARRVARAVFVATAATEGQENLGIDDKRIYLGVVQPGEKIPVFGDALRRLADRAKFMHSDLGRWWYSRASNLNRMAIDRAGQLEGSLILKIDKMLSEVIRGTDRGQFTAVQVAPGSSADVPDEAGGVRAVVLGVAHGHTGHSDSSDAMAEVRDILLQRGNAPRVYRNTLVFLAADSRQMDTLQDAMGMYLAWNSIVHDAERLDLRTSDIALATAKTDEARETVKTRLKETWRHLIYPYQDSPQLDMQFASCRIPSQDGILSRASKKLVGDETLLPEIGPVRLNGELEKTVWADKPHLSLKDLWEYLNRYTYLPRLKNRETLVKAVKAAVSGKAGPFAYAERWNADTGSYAGLVMENAPHAPVVLDSESLIVRPEVARSQPSTPAAGLEPPTTADPGAKETAAAGGGQPRQGVLASPATRGEPGGGSKAAPEPRLTRFQGTVMLSSDRPARDMSRIVEAVVQQLTMLPGADVSLKLEIDAEVAAGLDQAKVRTLMENAATLGFIDKLIE